MLLVAMYVAIEANMWRRSLVRKPLPYYQNERDDSSVPIDSSLMGQLLTFLCHVHSLVQLIVQQGEP